jgi:hypothetical protein
MIANFDMESLNVRLLADAAHGISRQAEQVAPQSAGMVMNYEQQCEMSVRTVHVRRADKDLEVCPKFLLPFEI